jgi:hypothetical protein
VCPHDSSCTAGACLPRLPDGGIGGGGDAGREAGRP